MSYDTEVLADSPLFYLKLDETSGPGATDLGSAPQTWHYSTAAVFAQTGLVADGGTSVSNLSTSAQDLIYAGPFTSVGGSEFSAEVWINNVAGSPQQAVLVALETSASIALYLVMADSSGVATGTNFLIEYSTPGGVSLTYSAPLAPGPHHLVATVTSGGLVTAYVDGVAVGTPVTDATYPPVPMGAVEVGGVGPGSLMPTSDVLFDCIAVYDSALSPTRIAAHYTAGTGGAAPSLRADGRTAVTVHGGGTLFTSGISNGVARVYVRGGAVLDNPSTARTVAGLVLTMYTPAIVAGTPTMPAWLATLPSTATALEGATHIHSITDPDPIWDPRTSGWSHPPPPVKHSPKPWSARWSVDSLPDPGAYDAGFYWLGDPSGSDGTSSIQSGARQWAADGSIPGMPPWRSHYPFKPSVTVVNHYLQGGGIVHHPKGVNFNSHFIEHMWLDFDKDVGQPFTWVMAGMITSWPTPTYAHTLLDAGVGPGSRGISLSAADCNDPRHMPDNQGYRTTIRVTPDHMISQAFPAGHTARCFVTPREAPCMFIAVFNGTSSYLGLFRPGYRKLTKGHLNTDHTRAVVMGRQYGWLAQGRASHMLMFEVRFWDRALDTDDLDAQYNQISSTHQFDAYRSL